MRYDTTLKELFQTLPQKLLMLLVGLEAVELLTVEFPSVKKRLPDLLVRLSDGSIFHLELQSDTDETMVWRMLEYYTLIRSLYPDTVLIQQVLYVGRKRPSFTTNIAEKTLQFRYNVRDIRDIDCRQMLSSSCLEENLLAILCRLENVHGTIREILTRIVALPSKEKADALEKLVILAGLRKLETAVQEEVKEMAISVDVMENAFLRDLFLKGERKGERKGRTALLLPQLEEKFGLLPKEVKKKVITADLSDLDKWSLRLLKADTLNAVFADVAD